ncbi:hypothetical protein SAMN04487897_11050 [Paenibacillus sp. yr247]|nr:hypothetical protein SAMN04487897_11050 [Paenibacillus sp. yr247]
MNKIPVTGFVFHSNDSLSEHSHGMHPHTHHYKGSTGNEVG